jgi:HlyD family secretion protein
MKPWKDNIDHGIASTPCRALLLAAALFGAMVVVGCRNDAQAAVNEISGSGVVEARTVTLSFNATGRLTQFAIEEGQEVTAGAVIGQLDTQELQMKIRQAEAAEAEADAQHRLLANGAREEEIRQAKAVVSEADAQIAASKKEVENAKRAYHLTPELSQRADVTDAQITAARAAVAEAEQALKRMQEGARPEQLTASESAVARARLTKELAEKDFVRMQRLFAEGAIARQQFDASQTARDTAAATLGQAEAELRDLRQGPRPTEIRQAELRLERARAELNIAEISSSHAKAELETRLVETTALDAARASETMAHAHRVSAQAQLNRIRSGSRAEEIAAASKRLLAATAIKEQLKVQIAERTLRAPRRATVLTKAAEVGEVVNAGASLATLADLQDVWVRVYISETQYGRVKLGQKAHIRVDSYPQRSFEGRVIEIASRPEFTPRNVQTVEERSKLVYGVKVLLANPDGALKPGMPADCVLEP